MIIKTKFDGLILVKNKKFNDTRGYFKELREFTPILSQLFLKLEYKMFF
jgi:dTDP-4-dehydrorhamnose 3,5-epimerase-like enzyme